VKGYLLGLASTVVFCALSGLDRTGCIFYLLLLPPLVSFIALNFTGASTFTSLTGAKIEVSISLPVLGLSAAAGIILKTVLVIRSIIA
jgi:hypothetical protein